MTLMHSQTATGKNWPRSPATLKPGDDPDADGGPNGFGDLLSYMDTVVWQIMAELDTLKLRENTLLIFTGDNGTDNTITSRFKGKPFKGGKNSMTEAGTRVPLIVSWPGTVPPDRVLNDLVDLTDFLPTLLEAAGVNLPSDYQVDGRSFLPQLRGQQGQPREWVYKQLGKKWFIRDRQYRLDSQGGFMDLTDRYHPKPAADSVEAAEALKRFQTAFEKLRPTPAR